MKRVRLELQGALGLGDAFGEGELEDEASAPLHKKSREIAPLPETQEARAALALRVARLIGACCGKLGAGGEGGKVSQQLLLRDLRVNAQLPQEKAYVELGLWHKVERATKKATRAKKTRATRPFQQHYVESVATWFADDLDEIRKREANFDARAMQMMGDALRAGEDLFSDEERALIMQ